MKKISIIHFGWLLLLSILIGACSKSEADKPERSPITPGSNEDKSVINWTVDGASYSFGGNAIYSPSVDKVSLGSLDDDNNYQIDIVFKGNKEGQFKMGNSNEAGKASIVFMDMISEKEYVNTYVEDCRQGGFVYTEGEVNITRVGKVGDYIEGNFSATLYDSDHCNSKAHVKVKGQFKLLRVGS